MAGLQASHQADRVGAYPVRPVTAVAARAAVPPVGAAAPKGREAAAPWSPRFRAESEQPRGLWRPAGGQPMLTRICPGHPDDHPCPARFARP